MSQWKRPVSTADFGLGSTADLRPVSIIDVRSISTDDTSPVPTKDIWLLRGRLGGTTMISTSPQAAQPYFLSLSGAKGPVIKAPEWA